MRRAVEDWRAEFDEYATGWLLEQDERAQRERDWDDLHGIPERSPEDPRLAWVDADEAWEAGRDARIWEADWEDHT